MVHSVLKYVDEKESIFGKWQTQKMIFIQTFLTVFKIIDVSYLCLCLNICSI